MSDQVEKSSVYDFFYHDSQRIASFLSQFDPQGHLKNTSQSKSVKGSEQSLYGAGSRGGIPGFATLKGDGQKSESQSTDENMTRYYDPFWANALAFLDYLVQHNLLHENLQKAPIGSFFLATGPVKIFNTDLLQKAYQNPHIQNETIKKATGSLDPYTGEPRSEEEVRFELEFHSHIEPQTHMFLQDDQRNVIWCSLKSDHMLSSYSDLLVKYGSGISGDWSLIGIKDAYSENKEYHSLSDTSEIDKIIESRTFLHDSDELSYRLHKHIGRPDLCIGVSPIIIFRSVGDI